MSAHLYRHPDGEGVISHAPGVLICTNEATGTVAHVAIGPLGLIELGRELIALGNAGTEQAATCGQRKSSSMTPVHTPDQLAEQAGSMIGGRLLNDLLRAPTQADALPLIQAAISDMNHPASVAGFSVQLVDVLMRGLRNLPRVDDEWGDVHA